MSIFINRAGVTVLRNLEWYENTDDQDGHQQIAWMMIVIPIIILFLPQIGNAYKENFKNKILLKQNIDVIDAPVSKVKKQTKKVKTVRIKDKTKTKVQQVHSIEHSQEQSVKSQQLSEQPQNEENNNSIDDSNLSPKNEQEVQNQNVNIIQVLNIIDKIPNACIRQFSEFTFMNRIKRRKILFSNNSLPIKLELYVQEALQYVYYINTIVEDSMFNMMKEQNMNCDFRNQLSADENEEVQTHIRYVIRELECMIPQYQRLLLKDLLHYYAYQISLVDQKHPYIAQLPKYLNEIYLSAVLNILLQDLAWKEMGIEEEQKQHLLKTFTNNCEILNLQFELDEKLKSIE